MSDANVQDDCKWQVVEAKWLGVLETESIKDIYQYGDQAHCFDKKVSSKQHNLRFRLLSETK